MADSSINFSVVFSGNTSEKLAQLRDWMAKLRELEVAWADINVVECHEKGILDSLAMYATPRAPVAVGKLVDLYATILEEHGQPMHVREITAEALRRGAVLKGIAKASPEQKVRNSLFGSKKFINIGGNTWWLADQSSEEHQARTCANT